MTQIMKKCIYQFAFSNYIQGSFYTTPGESYPFSICIHIHLNGTCSAGVEPCRSMQCEIMSTCFYSQPCD